MATQLQFYLDRAAEARSDAEAATLDNVRDRCIRAALAWEKMAQRAALTDTARAKLAEEKAIAAIAAVPQPI